MSLAQKFRPLLVAASFLPVALLTTACSKDDGGYVSKLDTQAIDTDQELKSLPKGLPADHENARHLDSTLQGS